MSYHLQSAYAVKNFTPIYADNQSTFILFCGGKLRSAEKIKIKQIKVTFIFILVFKKNRVGAPENQKIKKVWPYLKKNYI